MEQLIFERRREEKKSKKLQRVLLYSISYYIKTHLKQKKYLRHYLMMQVESNIQSLSNLFFKNINWLSIHLGKYLCTNKIK
jgi:hypothetical protein